MESEILPKKSSGTAQSVYKLICALSKKEQNDLAMILKKDRETLVGIAFKVVISKLGKIHERTASCTEVAPTLCSMFVRTSRSPREMLYLRKHSTLKATPAMASGLAVRPWTVEELLTAR